LGEVRFAPRRNKPLRFGKRLRAVTDAFFIELNIACCLKQLIRQSHLYDAGSWDNFFDYRESKVCSPPDALPDAIAAALAPARRAPSFFWDGLRRLIGSGDAVVAASAPPHRAPFSGPSWLRRLLLREGQRRQQHGGDDQCLQHLSASILHVLHLCFMVSVLPSLLWL
jgi:hypothetical protein